MSYKVEELLALRDSVSESAVSIDKFPDEEAIKEHVLRPSASACQIGAPPDNVPRSAIAPAAVSATTSTKKPSPSPSIKRGKAERLLKEHGSPPGMRVTAGGRVVPSDLPPLSNARFNSNNLRAQPARGISPGNPSSGKPALENNNNNNKSGQGVFTHNGQAYLFIDNQLIPINANLAMGSTFNSGQLPGFPDPTQTLAEPRLMSVPPQMATPAMPAPVSFADLMAVKHTHAARKQELKQLEQLEVLQAPHESELWRSSTIQRKKSLVIEIDNLRRTINAMETERAKNIGAPTQPTQSTQPTQQVPVAPSAALPVHQFPPPVFPSMYPPAGYPVGAPTNAFTPPYLMYGQPFPGAQFIPMGSMGATPLPNDPRGLDSSESCPVAGPFVTSAAPVAESEQTGMVARDNSRQSPPGLTSAMRRSHALEIKPPKDRPQNSVAHSNLNPKSPTYEPSKPVSKVPSRANMSFIPPTPSPGRTPDRVLPKASLGSMRHEQPLKQKSSMSSVSTTDFFPLNTHEHSLTRAAPPKLTPSKQASREDFNLTSPVTPDRAWAANPWNTVPRSSSKSTSEMAQPSPLQTIWSESYGNTRTGVRREDSGPPHTSESTGSAKNWLFAATTPVHNIPSTFQEGYQAGIAHVGIPANREVIRGFIDGLVDVLNSLSSTSSSRGTPAALVQADSGVSMTFAASMSAMGKENRGNVPGSAPLSTPTEEIATKSNGEGDNKIVNEFARQYLRAGNQANISMKVDEPKLTTTAAAAAPSVAKESAQSQGESVSPTKSFYRVSGNHMGNRGMSNFSSTLPSLGAKESGYVMKSTLPSMRPKHEQRYSGYDGAMDDLAELMQDSQLGPTETTPALTQDAKATPSDPMNAEATCFGYSGKGKQKATGSPTKSSSSPKKSGEQSPTKAKLGQFAGNIVGKCGLKKDEEQQDGKDPANMTPDEKRRWREHWRKRFQKIGDREAKEIRQIVAAQEEEQDRNNQQRGPRRRRN